MDQHGYAVAIVGASGEVGRSMIETLERYPIPVSSLRLLASKRSAGKTLLFKKEPIVIEELSEDSFEGIDLAFFSTSAFRMDPTIPLVVPEVNAHVLSKNTRLIANPNCSTIQLVVALKPLIEAYGIESVNVSTYQAISGAGAKALYEYEQELSDESYEPQILPTRSDEIYYQIAHNVIPQIDVFLSSGYTKEEIKMINETQKILDDYELKVNATCVRVPVRYGHSVSVTVKLKKPVKDREEIIEVFKESPDVILRDNILHQEYPMPSYLAHQDEVFVGRVRKDLFEENVVHFWVVADNILKGAALNSVQIAYYMHRHGLLGD